MTPSYASLYPFLLVAVRVLYMAANNPGNFGLGDLLLVLLVTQVGTLLVYLLASVAVGRLGKEVPALATMVVVGAWFFGAPAVEGWLPEGLRESPLPVVGFGIIASVIVIGGLARRPAVLRVVGTFLTHMYVLLAIWLIVDVALDWRRGRQEVAASALIRELARPIPVRGQVPAPRRDIYVIVLDEYANDAVLRAVLGFDNSAFVDSLRALGFHVPRAVRSNYTQTTLSLAALLNAAHVHRVKHELPGGSNDATLVNHLVERNRVARFAQERGYRFVFFPSSWWYATRGSPIADSVVQVGPRLSPGRAVSRTEFRRAFWHNSLAAMIHREEKGDDEIVRSTLEELSRLSSDRRPVFAFAHLLSPHVPYVFDSSCGRRGHVWKRHPTGYTAQLQCLNRLLLAMVTKLIAESEIPPVIILQGDHGTAFLEYSSAGNPLTVHPTAAGERFGAFGAYFLPEGGADDLGDTVAVVNVLGHVLRRYLSADLPSEPDEQYLSIDLWPFDLHRVRPTWPVLVRMPPGPADSGAAVVPPTPSAGRVEGTDSRPVHRAGSGR